MAIDIEERKAIKRRIAGAGYTQEAFADLAGLTTLTISNYVNGVTKDPKHSTVTAIQKALWQVEPKLAPTEYVGWNDHQPLGSELTEKEAAE